MCFFEKWEEMPQDTPKFSQRAKFLPVLKMDQLKKSSSVMITIGGATVYTKEQ